MGANLLHTGLTQLDCTTEMPHSTVITFSLFFEQVEAKNSKDTHTQRKRMKEAEADGYIPNPKRLVQALASMFLMGL